MKYAFITGMGRSGTKFLSHLLALDQNIEVKHEFFGNREYWLVSWYLGSTYSKVILEQAKINLETELDKELFIDVNSYLSDSSESLRQIFKNPKIFHLVRNPKNVVPSLMIRRDDKGIHKIPKTEDEILAWTKMSKLEQVCVNWVQTTEDLLKSDTELLQFEKLIKDYNYLSEKVLIPLGINISEKDYNQLKSKKINKTRGWIYRFLYSKYKGKQHIGQTITFESFDEKQRQQFYVLCGPTMKKLGYS